MNPKNLLALMGAMAASNHIAGPTSPPLLQGIEIPAGLRDPSQSTRLDKYPYKTRKPKKGKRGLSR